MGAVVRASLIIRARGRVLFDILWAMVSTISAPGALLLGSKVAIRDANNPFWISYYLQGFPTAWPPGANYSRLVFASRIFGRPSGKPIIYKGLVRVC